MMLRERLLHKVLQVADDGARFRERLPTTWGSLENVARNGFKPGGILDIGAHKGHWAERVATIFPGVPIHMVEAQPELEPELIRAGFPYSLTLLGPESRAAVPFHVDPTSPSGGSVLNEVTNFPRDQHTYPMRRLDDLETGLSGPLLLKLDVQGYELEVLAGASETLRQTEMILAEVALLEYNENAPLIGEVIGFLAERGFVPFDICDFLRRYEDGAMFQCDMIFVRPDSPLRAKRRFYPHEG